MFTFSYVIWTVVARLTSQIVRAINCMSNNCHSEYMSLRTNVLRITIRD